MRFWCDDQFAVLPKVILCFITVGKRTDKSHLSDPSTVNWKPSRFDYAVGEEFPWFPKVVREVYRRRGQRVVPLRRHHMFLRPCRTRDFVYAGEAHLGNYRSASADGDFRHCEACFRLLNKKKLPRSLWLKCGGYADWCIEVKHKKRVVAQRDRLSFDKLLDRMEREKYSHLSMTRYEADSLHVYTNPTRAFPVYSPTPDHSGLYLRDSKLGTDETDFRCVCGISLDIPQCLTVSHSRAAQIARHFFRTGKLPSRVEWRQHEFC